MPDSDNIPLMYQAQVRGRSQIQYLEDLKETGRPQQQAYDWVDDWVEGCDRHKTPQFGSHVKTRPCLFTWRVVTNSGQDGGVIRPVIGERGWAYFPGSSMKGAFLRGCRKMATPAEVLMYCGGKDAEGNLHPGILRFHGGYPDSNEWLDNSLVDVVHPQEGWQANGKKEKHETPKIQISLYQPKFVFGISSTKTIEAEEWTRIWEIWEAALGRGIGSRVSAGYGQTKSHGANKLRTVGLRGQGLCSQRIDKVGEFRPNMFKAALRGHTRRLLSGVVDDSTADKLTRQLWGGFAGRDGSVVGVLGVAFSAPQLDVDIYQYGNNRMPVYETEDMALNILVMKDVSDTQQKNLGIFVTQLLKFAMLLGGFGKSWRRIDHRLFFPEYLNYKSMIGCHWAFTEKSQKLYIPVENQNLSEIKTFLEKLPGNIMNFPLVKAMPHKQPPQGSLREAWQKGRVQVWGRIAIDQQDSLAVRWFHGGYENGLSIYKSELTGKMGQISRIWHRMYPRFRKQEDRWIDTGEYVELLTIFPNTTGNPNEVEKTANFLKFLKDSGDFVQLW